MPGGQNTTSGLDAVQGGTVTDSSFLGTNPLKLAASAVPGLIVGDFVAPGDQIKMALGGGATMALSPFLFAQLGGSEAGWLRAFFAPAPAIATGMVYLLVRKSGNGPLPSLMVGAAVGALALATQMPTVEQRLFFPRLYFKTGPGSKITKKIPDWGQYGTGE